MQASCPPPHPFPPLSPSLSYQQILLSNTASGRLVAVVAAVVIVAVAGAVAGAVAVAVN